MLTALAVILFVLFLGVVVWLARLPLPVTKLTPLLFPRVAGVVAEAASRTPPRGWWAEHGWKLRVLHVPDPKPEVCGTSAGFVLRCECRAYQP